MPDRPNRNVVTRFAPSPTGYLHVGGARTALFNWAYARRHGGTFILRIEDTDAARSTAESTRRIIEDLVWLGLEWDEGPSADAIKTPDGDVYDLKSQRGSHGPYFQSQRNHLYTEYLARLVKIGRAYRCFKSPEQLKAERESQKASGGPMKYDPTEALNRSDADQRALITAGKPFVWRFRMPDADVTVHDLVLGDVTIKAAELEDFVIIKAAPAGALSSDISATGGPTFHFANVVDDATMEVTHVLRAQEHLMNTPKHVAMFDALGIARPKYAHMPLIFNPDSTKMSKRDKAKTARHAALVWEKKPGNSRDQLVAAIFTKSNIDLLTSGESIAVSEKTLRDFLEKKNDDPIIAKLLSHWLNQPLPEIDVHDFRESGYLSSVLLNYIALLGWNPGGNVPERFDLEWFVQNFSIDGIGKSNAKFDRVKLLAFNGESLAKLHPDEFRRLLRDALQPEHRFALILRDDAKFALFAECYRARSQTLKQPAKMGRFFVLPDIEIENEFDPKAVAKVLTANDRSGEKTLLELVPVLEAVDPWTTESIHKAVEKFATDTKRGMGDVAQPIRVAVSGTTVSPPIHDTLAILGKQSTINRLQRAAALS